VGGEEEKEKKRKKGGGPTVRSFSHLLIVLIKGRPVAGGGKGGKKRGKRGVLRAVVVFPPNIYLPGERGGEKGKRKERGGEKEGGMCWNRVILLAGIVYACRSAGTTGRSLEGGGGGEKKRREEGGEEGEQTNSLTVLLNKITPILLHVYPKEKRGRGEKVRKRRPTRDGNRGFFLLTPTVVKQFNTQKKRVEVSSRRGKGKKEKRKKGRKKEEEDEMQHLAAFMITLSIQPKKLPKEGVTRNK